MKSPNDLESQLPETNPLENLRKKLATEFFYAHPNPLVNGIAIGSMPEDGKPDAPAQGVTPKILVFVSPSADCEAAAINQGIKAKAGSVPYQMVRSSLFSALQTGTGASVSPYAPLRSNVPLLSTGTFGALVKVQNQEYLLTSNHVAAHNGRVPEKPPHETPILTRGLVDDVGGGVAIAFQSYLVPLQPSARTSKGLAAPAQPATPPTPNQVDCALARIQPGAVQATVPVPLFSGPLAGSIPVRKNGRTTQVTNSQITIFSWEGWIDFSFGIYHLQEMLGTYDQHFIFAAPGDSGSLGVVSSGAQQGAGIGLITARGYTFDATNKFTGYIILMCRLDKVAAQLAAEMNVNPGDLKFFQS